MAAIRRIFNWRYVDAGFRSDVPWTRFVVDVSDSTSTLQLPILLDGEWPAGPAGPTVVVSQAWYDEFRYRIEHALIALYQKLVEAYVAQDGEEVERLRTLVDVEQQMCWAEERPILIRELLHAW